MARLSQKKQRELEGEDVKRPFDEKAGHALNIIAEVEIVLACANGFP